MIVDEDGSQVAKAEGTVTVGKAHGLPAAWSQHVNLVLPLTGIALPKPGQYRMSLLVDDSHVVDVPFRVIKGF